MSSQDQDEALETVSSIGKAEEDSGMTGEPKSWARPAGQLRSVGHSHKTADPALLLGVGKVLLLQDGLERQVWVGMRLARGAWEAGSLPSTPSHILIHAKAGQINSTP